MQPWSKRFLGWRGFPALVALLALGALASLVACDDTGPSPIGDHAPDDVDSGSTAKPTVDAAGEGGDATTEDAEAGPDEDAGQDAGTDVDADAGDAGMDADAGKDAHS